MSLKYSSVKVNSMYVEHLYTVSTSVTYERKEFSV